MKRTSLRILAPFALAALLLFPSSSQAIGLVTEPITIKKALRETAYNEMMTIINTENSIANIKLSAEGDIAGWTRFYKNASDTDNITDITISAGGKTEAFARFVVPAGTPNGTYKGNISVSRLSPAYEKKEGESGNAVTQKIDCEVAIEVDDAENIDFDASVIPDAYDMSSGNILRIRIIYDNRSNVMIDPQISIKIRQDGNVVYSAIFPYPDSQPKVSPYSLYEIPALEIPTSNLGTGRYDALLTLSEEDRFSIDKDFRFSIGTVLAASASAAEGADRNSPDAAQWALAIAGMALYAALRIRSRRHRKFEGRIDTDGLSQR